MPVFTDTTPPPSLADLRRAFYGGGSDAEYNVLLAAQEAGRSATDVIAPKYLWWQHTVPQVTTSAVWTPLAWNQPRLDVCDIHTGYTAATTIAAGSNNAALPQGTINVVSTTGFAAATAGAPKWLTIRFADAADRVIQYTGLTATTFTGCTLGNGTMLTGQAVAQADVAIVGDGNIYPIIAEACFAANATGGRAIRIKDVTTGLPMAQAGPFNVPNEAAHVQVTMQMGVAVGQTSVIEVKQTSGGALNVVVDGLQSPSLMAMHAGPYPYPS